MIIGLENVASKAYTSQVVDDAGWTKDDARQTQHYHNSSLCAQVNKKKNLRKRVEKLFRVFVGHKPVLDNNISGSRLKAVADNELNMSQTKTYDSVKV